MQETWVQFLGQEDPRRKKWQPTPVFLPRESHGQRGPATVHRITKGRTHKLNKGRETLPCPCEWLMLLCMLGGQLVTLLLKSGFWSHSTVGSSSLICRIATTYHHQCQFYVCVCVCVFVCVVGSCVRVSRL